MSNILFDFLVRPLTASENGPSPATVAPATRIEYSVSFCRPVIVVVVVDMVYKLSGTFDVNEMFRF